MNRRQAAVVAGVHGLEHVERFFAADFADDDTVRAHTESVDDEVPLPDSAAAFNVGWTRFKPHDVPLTKHQFRCVFNGDDPFLVRDEAGQDIQQCRLAGASAARDKDVEAAGDGCPQEVQHRLRQ